MKLEKQKSLGLILVSAVILAALNVGVWLAAKHGMMAPIGNHVLWTAFAVLNVVSFIWAISLLGLHPLFVALSYVAGGFLAFKGVQGISGVNVAELTTAGATYSAFGALAIGSSTAKVRLAYYNKKQISFVFIIAALLVFDAVLSSELPGSDRNIMLNAMVFPFMLSGVAVGLVWTVVSRYGAGKKSEKLQAVIVEEPPETVEEVEELEAANTLKIQMPVDAMEEEDVDTDLDTDMEAALMEEVEVPEITEPVIEETVRPVVALEETVEEFFPLEIDKDDDFYQPEEKPLNIAAMVAELDGLNEEPYNLPAFDASLHDSGLEEVLHDGLAEEESAVSLPENLNELEVVAEDPEKEPVAEIQHPETDPPKTAKSADWLNGHLDLLNKLK